MLERMFLEHVLKRLPTHHDWNYQQPRACSVEENFSDDVLFRIQNYCGIVCIILVEYADMLFR